MPKKVEPVMCLCGKVPERHGFTGTYWTVCMNKKCIVMPGTKVYASPGAAVRAWNNWIRNGVRRLAKVVEEAHE